jgi:hypothetical protein
MLSVKRVKHNMQLAFIEKLSPIVRLELTCKQDIYVSKVCRTRVKSTCATLVVFNYRKLWPGFNVATRSLR